VCIYTYAYVYTHTHTDKALPAGTPLLKLY
jgi:hypothetical protein